MEKDFLHGNQLRKVFPRITDQIAVHVHAQKCVKGPLETKDAIDKYVVRLLENEKKKKHRGSGNFGFKNFDKRHLIENKALILWHSFFY